MKPSAVLPVIACHSRTHIYGYTDKHTNTHLYTYIYKYVCLYSIKRARIFYIFHLLASTFFYSHTIFLLCFHFLSLFHISCFQCLNVSPFHSFVSASRYQIFANAAWWEREPEILSSTTDWNHGILPMLMAYLQNVQYIRDDLCVHLVGNCCL